MTTPFQKIPARLRNKMCGGLSSIVFLASYLSAQADVPDIFHFHEEDELEYVTDSGGSAFRWKLSKGSEWSSEQVRFGKGSLRINPADEDEGNRGTAWEVMINTQELEAFQEEIRKLTIIAWIRPAELESFMVFWRIPFDTSLPGFFQFAFLEPHKRLYFSAAGEEASHSLMSSEIALLPEEWNHLALVFDKGEVTFYFNGQQAGASQFIPVEVIPRLNHRLPSIKAMSDLKQGAFVDDLGIFGAQALNSDEIYTIYENGLEAFFNTQSNP